MSTTRTVKTVAVFAICLALTGCAPAGLDEIMGRTTSGTATTQPHKLDCDLIFPPVSVNP